MRRRASHRFAHLVTEVFSPFLLVAVLLTHVAVLTDPTWWWSALTCVTFLAGIPWLTSVMMVRRGRATDRFFRHRDQRHLFYALALGSMLLGGTALLLVPTSADLRLAAVLAVGTLAAIMVINTRVTISIHALSAALAASVIPAGLPHTAWWAIGAACWALSCWSRLAMRRHSVLDLTLGSLLGLGVGLLFLAWAPHYPGT
ncbi:hypothetical protein [Nesterenkonia suensis]